MDLKLQLYGFEKGGGIMKKSEENQKITIKKSNPLNECPEKDKDGNCLVPGAYRDSEPIGGG
ncbi:MAG: hypothetical protein E7222_07265 [Clostridiales bacterium]|jgi:hypothetical protein|uniref:hypothetical protein n=1 Tax=Aminipila sp. TaxID=2060095 RepID=UPI001DCE0CA9|nr:hypothetical protein [Aminipila sp.]MBE6034487.1 hypothetical protein [Clostridiales bacterium]